MSDERREHGAKPQQQGDLLVVPVGCRLPKLCLKCGTTEGVARRPKTYTVGTASSAAGGIGGVLGASLARSMRDEEPILLVAVVTVIIALVGAGAWLVQRAAKKVELEVPLCDACLSRAAEGELLRTRLLIGLGASFVVLGAGWALSSTPVLVGGGLLFAVALVATFAAKLPSYFLVTPAITEKAVSFKLEPGLAERVLERIARREAKKQKAEG